MRHLESERELVAELSVMANRCSNVCDIKGWGKDWKEGGSYLHLEASEFVESLRGKHGIPEHEVADVLFVLLAMVKHHNVNLQETIKYINKKLEKIEYDTCTLR